MIKTAFLVPLADNGGQPFTPQDWQALHERLMRFGGFSRRDGVFGAWQYQGQVYEDQSREYTVALSLRQLSEWLEILEWVKETFRQKAVYVEINGAPEILGV